MQSFRSICWIQLAIICLLLLAPNPVLYAQVDTFQFATPEQQQRVRRLSNELRCPMCQNTNLTGSTGGTAEDLRREIHRMIIDGMSDQEIEQFMFERYGDFIFYRPRLRAETLLLWFGPAIFFVIGAGITFIIWRRSKPALKKEAVLDEAEKRRLSELLEHNDN